MKRKRCIAALDFQVERFAATLRNYLCQIIPLGNCFPVYSRNDIINLDAGSCCRFILDHLTNLCSSSWNTHHEDQYKNKVGKNQVEYRTGYDDNYPLQGWLG